MNKSRHLFDACVSHRNTLQVQRKAEEFFYIEEGKFYDDYYGMIKKQLLRTYNKYQSFFNEFEDFKKAYEWWNMSRACIDTSFRDYATNWIAYEEEEE